MNAENEENVAEATVDVEASAPEAQAEEATAAPPADEPVATEENVPAEEPVEEEAVKEVVEEEVCTKFIGQSPNLIGSPSRKHEHNGRGCFVG